MNGEDKFLLTIPWLFTEPPDALAVTPTIVGEEALLSTPLLFVPPDPLANTVIMVGSEDTLLSTPMLVCVPPNAIAEIPTMIGDEVSLTTALLFVLPDADALIPVIIGEAEVELYTAIFLNVPPVQIAVNRSILGETLKLNIAIENWSPPVFSMVISDKTTLFAPTITAEVLSCTPVLTAPVILVDSRPEP